MLYLLAIALLVIIGYYVLPVLFGLLGWLMGQAFQLAIVVCAVLGALWLICWAV